MKTRLRILVAGVSFWVFPAVGSATAAEQSSGVASATHAKAAQAAGDYGRPAPYGRKRLKIQPRSLPMPHPRSSRRGTPGNGSKDGIRIGTGSARAEAKRAPAASHRTISNSRSAQLPGNVALNGSTFRSSRKPDSRSAIIDGRSSAGKSTSAVNGTAIHSRHAR